jgi:hypothetical protein
MRGRLSTALIVAVVAMGGVAADGPTVAGATARCGNVIAKTPSGKRRAVAVRVTSGEVPCERARRIIKRFLDSGRPSATSGWLCGAGYAGQRDIASCYSSRRAAAIAARRAR